ncbi:MAG: hypothetical protein P8K80_10450 [Phycisphaerales bacterium]|nr:hypothetical protein [Phycisphaerales bacterium]
MLIYAGIDEAGYGPMLGPLTIGCSIFSMQDHDAATGAPDLWSRLDHAVCRGRRDRGGRLAVDDSKKLKGAKGGRRHPLHHLERGVLAFLGATEDAADWLGALDDIDVLSKLGASVPDHAWYQGCTSLPLGEDRGLLGIASARLKRSMAEAGVSCRRLSCELIDADAFNHEVGRTGNKASVNFEAVLRRVQELRTEFRDHDLHVVIDRQGGRTRYRQDLQYAWPDDMIQVLDEDPRLCRYRLRTSGSHDGAGCSITFAQGGEDRHLPIALASMTAKYCRELLMIRMNTYFTTACPGLDPTAGYVQDARRYLQDIDGIIQERNINRDQLIRSC